MKRMPDRTYTDRSDRQLQALLNQQEVAWQYGEDTDIQAANTLIIQALEKRLPTKESTADPKETALVRQRNAFMSGDQDRLQRANDDLLSIIVDIPDTPRPQVT